jgi:hypothetical protein
VSLVDGDLGVPMSHSVDLIEDSKDPVSEDTQQDLERCIA